MYAEQWTTKDGQKVHVFEMSDDHLANCINMIQRSGWRQHWLQRLIEEQRNRRRT